MLGRPRQNEVLALAEKMDRILPEETVLVKLAELVDTGNVKAIALWLNYRRGMPKQIVEQKSEHTLVNFNVRDLLKFDDTTEPQV